MADDTPRLAVSANRQGVLDPDPQIAAQDDEILDRAEVDIGRFIPLERQRFIDRHPAAQEKGKPVPPVGEIGKGNDGLAADTQKMLHHLVRAVHGLQGLAQNNIVESMVGIIADVRFGVALDYGKARRRAYLPLAQKNPGA